MAAAETATPPITKSKAAVLRTHADELRRTQRVVALQPGSVTVPEVSPDRSNRDALAAQYGLQSVLNRW